MEDEEQEVKLMLHKNQIDRCDLNSAPNERETCVRIGSKDVTCVWVNRMESKIVESAASFFTYTSESCFNNALILTGMRWVQREHDDMDGKVGNS